MLQAIILFMIFILLSILHFSWALGSKWGFNAALPRTEDGELVMSPSKKDSAIVGIALLLFGIFYLIKSGLINFVLPDWAMSSISWVIPIIFILRALGDTKYVGFSKKIKTTEFARRDTIFYSPFCLFIGILGLTLINYPS